MLPSPAPSFENRAGLWLQEQLRLACRLRCPGLLCQGQVGAGLQGTLPPA